MSPLTRALVLRPEPGNAAICARLKAAGVSAVAAPLFVVQPVAWTLAKPGRYDALLLTSANAARHAGDKLARLSSLPVIAVGPATAAAARSAGLSVAVIGSGDAGDALDSARRAGLGARILHLAGRHRREWPGVEPLTVYQSVASLTGLPNPHSAVALLHSVRAAERFARLVDPDSRNGIAIAALSRPVAWAAGDGWQRVEASVEPNDAALVALAASMIDRAVIGSDKPEP